jgi:predicted NBD/HSP70 family sugar kinase
MANSKALNSSRMKERNYQRFFSELRARPMTRAQLARQMDVTRASTSLIADDLLSKGLIIEGSSNNNDRQSTKVLSWNSQAAYSAAICILRDRIVVGVSDLCGNVHDQFSFSILEMQSADQAIDTACASLKQILKDTALPGTFLGIGITSPGPLDTGVGTILNPPFFDLFNNYHITDRLKEDFDCDLVLENDTNALALAEKVQGGTVKYDRILELLVDIGIGAALILDGKLIVGPSGFGNGFGHTSININGPKCECGNIGCVEMYASIPRIVSVAQKLDASLSSWHSIVDMSYMGNGPALEVLYTEAGYLATLIVNVSNALDIEAVFLTGEQVLYRPKMILKIIADEVNKRIASREERSVLILPSQLPTDPVVKSGSNLIIEKYLERPFIFSGQH